MTVRKRTARSPLVLAEIAPKTRGSSSVRSACGHAQKGRLNPSPRYDRLPRVHGPCDGPWAKKGGSIRTARRGMRIALAGAGVALLTACSSAAAGRGRAVGAASPDPPSPSFSSPSPSPVTTRPRPCPSPTATKPKPRPLSQLPRGGRTIFPRYRVVAYYGAAGIPILGVLGTADPDTIAAEASARAAQYASAGRLVLPAFELITTMAQ